MCVYIYIYTHLHRMVSMSEWNIYNRMDITE